MILSNEIEKKLGANDSLNLSPDIASSEVIASYLRTIHGRNDLSMALNQFHNNFESKIEAIRVNLNSYNLDVAQAALDVLEFNNQEEYIEIQLERARLYLFKNNHDQAAKIARDAFNMATISPTKMTLAQLLGDINLHLKKYEKAEYYLDTAIEIGNHFPLLSATWSAHAFKILYLIKNQQINKAKIKLEKLYTNVKELNGDVIVDRLIIVLRTQFHLYKYLEDKTNSFEVLSTCNELCKWNGDFNTKVRNDNELKTLKPSSNLQIFHFSDWIFLPRINLILTKEPKTVVNLECFPIVVEFLNFLSRENKEVTFEEIFLNLKQQDYNHEIHLPYIKNIIQRSRKKLPKNSLKVKNNKVSLL